MTDERDNGMRPDVYDDDRLLACALGLDEDPELLAAAATDAELGARLEAMRADVAAIGAQVADAVPAPDESYTDLSGERWSGLKEFFEAPSETARPRRERRWWRVLTPVAALVAIALVVGIVAVNGGIGGLGGSSGSSSGTVAQSAGDGAASSESFSGNSVSKGGQAVTSPERATLRERFRDELNRFAVVVLARARQVSGVVQRFAVLRTFKGSAPKVVELVVNDQPTDAGRLHVLMLDPTAPPEAQQETPWPLTESPAPAEGSPLPVTISPMPETASPWPETTTPLPIPSMAAADGVGQELAVSYTYDGEPTVVRELPAGTDPATVDISIP